MSKMITSLVYSFIGRLQVNVAIVCVINISQCWGQNALTANFKLIAQLESVAQITENV